VAVEEEQADWCYYGTDYYWEVVVEELVLSLVKLVEQVQEQAVVVVLLVVGPGGVPSPG
jgi:hypothetical protein